MRLTNKAHDYIRAHIEQPKYSLDATCGSGYDTLFLASITQNKVWSFDVQAEALAHAQEKVNSLHCQCSVEWIHDGHQSMDRYIDTPLDVVMFNFGYWPKGDPQITTMADDSLVAIQKAVDILSPEGVITLLLYPGHPQGKIEAERIQTWIQALPNDRWTTEVFYSQSPKPDAPILWGLKPKI